MLEGERKSRREEGSGEGRRLSFPVMKAGVLERLPLAILDQNR